MLRDWLATDKEVLATLLVELVERYGDTLGLIVTTEQFSESHERTNKLRISRDSRGYTVKIVGE